MMQWMLVCFSYSLSVCHAVVQAFVFFEQKTDGKDVLRRSAILLALQVCVCVCVYACAALRTCMYARTRSRSHKRTRAQNLGTEPKP